jgi:hypothetical protein
MDFSSRHLHTPHIPSGVLTQLKVLPTMSAERIWYLVGQRRLAYILAQRQIYVPVMVNNMVILTVSPSITCAPVLEPVGDKRLVMAWIPCSVPARTRYSLDVSCASPSAMRMKLKLSVASITWFLDQKNLRNCADRPVLRLC